MNLAAERKDYQEAGALAEELPWWGWLPDERTCLTRAGELLTIGRLTPHVQDGRTAEELDTVLDRWARMLSSVEPGSRIGLYFTRGPLAIESGGSDPGDNVGAIARRHRGEFLTARVQETTTHIVWCHNPGLQQTRSHSGAGPWWMEYAKSWLARQRAPHESVYLHTAASKTSTPSRPNGAPSPPWSTRCRNACGPR